MSRVRLSPFRVEEDAKVLELVGEGRSWHEIASALGSRKARQVHERYINYLSPDLRTCAWTEGEDAQLLRLVEELGHSWSKIAERLPGRSQGAVKNRYNGHLSEEGGVRSKRTRQVPAPREQAEAFLAKSRVAMVMEKDQTVNPSIGVTVAALEPWTFSVEGLLDWEFDLPWRLDDGDF
jgi:hypothetical protein